MKDWIKKALTKRIRQREIPPDPRLVYGVKFTIATTIILSTLEIAHIIFLGKWNSENLLSHNRPNRHTHHTEGLTTSSIYI